jgi:hypothetical protein
MYVGKWKKRKKRREELFIEVKEKKLLYKPKQRSIFRYT